MQPLGHFGGVGRLVQHIFAIAGRYSGHIIGCTGCQSIGIQLIVVRGDIFHRQRYNIGTVLGVGESNIHLVRVCFKFINIQIGNLNPHRAVKGIPVIVQFRGALISAARIFRRGGLRHTVLFIGQIRESVDLSQIGTERIIKFIRALAAVGVALGGVNGFAGVDEAVVVTGGIRGAEVQQIILCVFYTGKAVVSAFVHGEIRWGRQLTAIIGDSGGRSRLLLAVCLQGVQDGGNIGEVIVGVSSQRAAAAGQPGRHSDCQHSSQRLAGRSIVFHFALPSFCVKQDTMPTTMAATISTSRVMTGRSVPREPYIEMLFSRSAQTG